MSLDAATSTDAAGDVVLIGGCKVPVTLTASAEALGGQCRGAARALLSCGSSTVMELCLSDEAQCPPSDVTVDAGGPVTCQNQCGASEFAIVCGSIGPGSPGDSDSPPTGCRAVAVTPGGTTFYCCGCGA